MSFDPTQPVVISRHASLKLRPQGDALVLPERALRVSGSGTEILRLCCNGATGESIVRAMQTRYPEATGIEAEVQAFLAQMFKLGGLVVAPSETKGDA